MARRPNPEHRPAEEPPPPPPPHRPWLSGLLALTLIVFAGLTAFQLYLIKVQLDLGQQQWRALESTRQEHLFWIVCQPTASAQERTNAFLRLVEAKHPEWRSAALNELRLQGCDLSLADLRLAQLIACDLRESRLNGALLTDSSLRLADLTKADLSDALLDGADLLKATLDDANFRKARMRRVSLEQVQAHRAQFILADLSEAHMLMADLTGANLTGADLTGARLEWAKLIGADVGLTNLTDANFENADLTNSNWWRARGLTDDQLTDFSERFAPTTDADESRRNDFQLWLASWSGEGTPSSAPDPQPTLDVPPAPDTEIGDR